MSEWFPVNVGFRQGCVMSPWLFDVCILYMDNNTIIQYYILLKQDYKMQLAQYKNTDGLVNRLASNLVI